MKRFQPMCLGLLLLPATSLWSQQVDSTPVPPVPAVVGTANSSDAMLAPPPVSGESYPTAFTSEERSNYLRGGMAFASAYTDNALGSLSGQPVSDISYSVAPFIALDETTSRMHVVSTYAPGFTFYQKTSSRNETDQNASIDFRYRLSPHVTFSARDGFVKSSNVFNQLATPSAVSGGIEEANFSVVAPIADRLSNVGNIGIASQFAANGMIGASGTFTNLHYPDQAEVPGLYDSSSQAGSVFYSHRISKMHYLGATYQYQRLMAYPAGGTSETQTHAILFFYTLYATSHLSMSVFGGPQHSDTTQPVLLPLQIQSPEAKAWTPAAGGSLSWQGRLTTVAVSYSHLISGGGGLLAAVHMDSAAASLRQQMTRSLSASLAGGYVQNDLLGTVAAGASNGHTVSGTASVQQLFGQHLSLELGYTRLHQNYSEVAVLATTPDTNREYVSISYQFSRPLGR